MRKNNIYLLILLLISLHALQAAWVTLEEFGQDGQIDDTQFNEWNIVRSEENGQQDLIPPAISQCGIDQLFGGSPNYSRMEITRPYLIPQQHSKVRITLDLWLLDDWTEENTFELLEDQNLLLFRTKPPITNEQNICGLDTPDRVMPNLQAEFDHDQDFLIIFFKDTLNVNPDIASWGLSKYKIEILVPDTDGEDGEDGEVIPPIIIIEDSGEEPIPIEPNTPNPADPTQEEEEEQDGEFCVNGLCFDNMEDLQVCIDNLNELSPLDKNNTSIQNNCEPFVENNIQKFFFSINYTGEFQFNEGCLDQTIKFEEITLQEDVDYTFDGELQSIRFDIPLTDFDEKFNCERQDTDEQLVWFCKIQHLITFGDTPQLEYNFKIQVTIDKTKEDDGPVVLIQRNVVEGFCCENQLNVQTALEFCSDFDCSSVLPSPLEVKRREDFFVRHKITSPEFQFLYLIGQQIRIGSFFPEIVNQRSDKGELVYHLRSDIAGDSFNVVAISRLSPTPETDSSSGSGDGGRRLRRRLQYQGDIPDNYKVKAESEMSIVGDRVESQDENQEGIVGTKYRTIVVREEKQSSAGQIGIILGIGVLVIGAVLISTVVCLKRRRNHQYRDQGV